MTPFGLVMTPGNCQDHTDLPRACQLLGKKEKDIHAIFLCGSRARGDHREDSDYDIMVVTESDDSDTYLFDRRCREYMTGKASVPEALLQVTVGSKKYYEKERKKGNSFIYCALRDGKVLFSRGTLNTALPKKCVRGGKDRMGLVRRHIEHIELSLEFYDKHYTGFKPRSLEKEDLGYASMHLCWAMCMLNNFCPVSKHTILRECRTYFTKEEFRSIKRAYSLYADQTGKGMRKKTFMALFKAMKRIIERIDGEYISKDSAPKTTLKPALRTTLKTRE